MCKGVLISNGFSFRSIFCNEGPREMALHTIQQDRGWPDAPSPYARHTGALKDSGLRARDSPAPTRPPCPLQLTHTLCYNDNIRWGRSGGQGDQDQEDKDREDRRLILFPLSNTWIDKTKNKLQSRKDSPPNSPAAFGYETSRQRPGMPFSFLKAPQVQYLDSILNRKMWRL